LGGEGIAASFEAGYGRRVAPLGAVTMQSLLRQHACPACTHTHNFVLMSGPVATGEDYAFCCPETGHITAMRAVEPGIPVSFPPQGAVALTRTQVREVGWRVDGQHTPAQPRREASTAAVSGS
jgi:hypothetical protein